MSQDRQTLGRPDLGIERWKQGDWRSESARQRLMRNRSGNFSVERLMDFLMALGQNFEITVRADSQRTRSAIDCRCLNSADRLPGVDRQPAMSKVRRDPIARRHCSRGFPLTSFTFSCRDGSYPCFAYNQRLERSEAIERLERFERPQVCHLLPRAYSITY